MLLLVSKQLQGAKRHIRGGNYLPQHSLPASEQRLHLLLGKACLIIGESDQHILRILHTGEAYTKTVQALLLLLHRPL